MKFTLIITLTLLIFNASCQENKKNEENMKVHKHSNALIHESSPYLLQHAHNPVNWHPWGEEALIKAKKENKPLLISIGYSACHWCHVMERESFENEEVAILMNEKFICIKVDREERPDVDNLYMNAVQLMTQQGGWPLNAFAMPDGRPFYGGTYFPKDKWIGVLKQVSELYNKQHNRVEEYAEQLLSGISQMNLIEEKSDNVLTAELAEKANKNLLNAMDTVLGGLNSSNKFPMPVVFQYLLDYSILSKNEDASKQLYITLNNMAKGGIYDQIGGGFARYSTDKQWKAPHFEKMLYDNAQLVSLYSHAYQKSKNPSYKKVVYETIDFLQRELMSEEYGFYSALDADSEGEEGTFYVWTEKEIDDILGDDSKLFKAYYQVGKEGLWEKNHNILLIRDDLKSIAGKFQIEEKEAEEKIKASAKKVLEARGKRIRPGLDDKMLCSWNALMLSALVDAYNSFSDEKFLKLAENNARFIQDKFIIEDQLMRNYKNGKSSINAFLEDYSLLIQAFLDFYQSTFDIQYLEQAIKLNEFVLANFRDPKSSYFTFSNAHSNELVAKHIDVGDNVIPSPNSVMAHNLFKLGKILGRTDYLEHANQMLLGVQSKIQEHPAYHANWFRLQLNELYPSYEVVVCGKNALKIKNELNDTYFANVLFAGSTTENNVLSVLQNRFVKGKSLIYVCQDNACKLPVEQVKQALVQLSQRKDK
ncbi:MAG: thioredoxin domain-containing protein [Bacteroidetes bacterium]|nr:thioredoxin domain-containing protein [Bacteroidota bacterium]